MKSRDVLAVFNRGRISDLALARTDVARVALSSEVQTNWIPRTLGAMSLRPGWQYHGAHLDDGAMIPFVFSNGDTAIIELTPSIMRIWDDGDTLVTRASVGSGVSNPSFTVDLTSWVDASEAGASTYWVTGGFLGLLGNGTAAAKISQQVTVAGADQGVEHSVRIVVERGPVILRIGTTAGADDVMRQAVLRTGVHSLAFTPTSNFYIEFSSALSYPVLVSFVNMEGDGTLGIATPWLTAEQCKSVRWHQSGDVVFCACDGLQPRRIERRPNNSWSVAFYQPDDGPFLTENITATTLTPSGLTGQITVTSSRPVFEDEHVGAIFSMSSQGQRVEADLTAQNTYTDSIRVTGVDTGRIFQVIRAGTWTGTLTLQRSIAVEGSWEDVATYATSDTNSYDDGLDNSIVYYRLGFNSGDYTSGTAEVSLTYDVGSITGVVRVTSVTSQTVANAVVLSTLGETEATEVWAEGAWSDAQNFPSAVAIGNEGRLWWSGHGRNYASVPDAFDIFDPAYEGDSAPLNRRVGKGAVNSVNWLLPLKHMIAGTDTAENAVRSTSFDEPVTPSNYNTRATSTKGSAAVPATYADELGFFVNRTGRKIYELEYDPARYDFKAMDTTLLVPEIGDSPFIRVAVQQTPDMRVHAVRTDGTVGVLVRDAAEDVLCWVDVETDGFVEDVVVLPGTDKDRVFYCVRRVINGSTVRYHEEWASDEDCRGGTLNLQADSFVTGTGLVTGLDHLEGESVVVWADGQDRGTETVSGGAVPGLYTSWVAGLGYTATYKSAKLAGQTALGLSLTQRSLINAIGLVLAHTHAQGVQYGPDFDTMDDLPLIEDGAAVDTASTWSSYDKGMVEFPGEWSTDNRVCLKAVAPRPCTVLGVVLNIDRQDDN